MEEESLLDKVGALNGVRVIEVADEMAEFCGLLLMGLGAEVIKIEPPGGSATRRIGPFAGDGPRPHTGGSDGEQSLYFWHYNRGKKSVTLDLTTAEGRGQLDQLLQTCDVLLQSVSHDHPDQIGLDADTLHARYPRLIHARMTPFGDSGPWATYKASDLVHLALGGVMMNCGYDPEPGNGYELPPIAPAMWHSYHISCDQLLISIQAALIERLHSRTGQRIDCAVHEAVAKSTEVDLMSWVMRRQLVYRQTCRHAAERVTELPTIAATKDGGWVMTMVLTDRDADRTTEFLKKYDQDAGGPAEAATPSPAGRHIPGTGRMSPKMVAALASAQRVIRLFTYERVPWRDAQAAGLLWVPVRRPEENLTDEHWWARGSFDRIPHRDGREYVYPVSKWISTANSWRRGGQAPLAGEHTEEVLRTHRASTHLPRPVRGYPARRELSPRGAPFPLEGVRILDFGWFLASAGGTRFLNALGAQSIKVEWWEHPDTRTGAMAPVGGRAARDRATAPLPPVTDPDMGGQFMNKNPGKLGISLNVGHPRGMAIVKELVTRCDVVAEGFSPGVMQRWGLGYEQLRELNPDIIYVQQSGMGSHGTYGRFRTLGPLAASLSGISAMSGLPDPAMPAGWGYSFLDWMAAYGFAQAILSALYHRELTGRGQWIDASQVESGIFLLGTALLEHQVNGHGFERFGNSSPYQPAAPSGAYRCAGDDSWIAITCRTDEEWRALARTAQRPDWLTDERLATLTDRIAHAAELDGLVQEWTSQHDAYELMTRLQRNQVAAGVCQTAGDRCDNDPQLRHLEWLTELTGTKIGTWPIPDLAAKLRRTPGYIGGRTNRGAPAYGEDNHTVLGELLGLREDEVDELRQQGVL